MGNLYDGMKVLMYTSLALESTEAIKYNNNSISGMIYCFCTVVFQVEVWELQSSVCMLI